MPGWTYGASSSVARDDEGQVRVAGLAQRGGHADRDRVRLGAGGKIGGGPQFARRHQASHRLGGHVQDVALAAVDHVHFFVHRVDPDHVETGLGKHHRQRQAHVAQAQNGHPGGFGLQFC